jgi:branched-chain amino acid transport system substrate-binding protein
VFDSKALSKIQSVSLIAIIIVAAVAGGVAYLLSSGTGQSKESIKIGVCADLDNAVGKTVWHGAVLAAEQVNAAGGVLGRNITIVAEDDDSEATSDIAIASNALNKLITVDKADFVVSSQVVNAIAFQDICAQQKKIYFSVWSTAEQLTQRVLDNYDKYEYFFRVWSLNTTSVADIYVDSLITLRNYTGFNKVAYISTDITSNRLLTSALNKSLTAHGFEVVYGTLVPATTTDFTSYFSAIEASGSQIIVPAIFIQSGYPFVKEWSSRQSPTLIWGGLTVAGESSFWNLTDGKGQYVSFAGPGVGVGYAKTNKSLPTREAYIQRWGDQPLAPAVAAYDVVRFILPDAIRRAGTTETEAVIKTLETTNVETSIVGHFRFTSSHDVFVGKAGVNKPVEDYILWVFQWQNGTQMPVYPKEAMEKWGITFKYPTWSGPWDNK